MDPNANLAEQLRLARKLINNEWSKSSEKDEYAARLAELVEALDGWLKGGGFLPEAWGVSWRKL